MGKNGKGVRVTNKNVFKVAQPASFSGSSTQDVKKDSNET